MKKSIIAMFMFLFAFLLIACEKTGDTYDSETSNLSTDDFETVELTTDDSETVDISTDDSVSVNLFHDDLLGLCSSTGCGYVDKNFEVVIPFIYNDINNFNGGFVSVDKGGYAGVIDSDGNEIIPFIYDYIYIYPEEGNILAYKYFLTYFFDMDGNELTFTEFYRSHGYVAGDLIAYNDHSGVTYGDSSLNRYGFKNIDGEIVIPCKYDSVVGESFTDTILVEKDDRYYLLDKDGNESDYLGFKRVYSGDYEGYYSVMNPVGNWGLANDQGEIIVPMEYQFPIILNENGYGIIQKGDDEFGLIDKEGNIILEPDYNLHDYYKKYDLYRENDYLIFYDETKFMLYDENAEMIYESVNRIVEVNDVYVVERNLTDFKYYLFDYDHNLLLGPVDNLMLDCRRREYVYTEDRGETVSLKIYDKDLIQINPTFDNKMHAGFVIDGLPQGLFEVYDISQNQYQIYNESFDLVYSTVDFGNIKVYDDGYILIVDMASVLILDYEGNELFSSNEYMYGLTERINYN